MTSGAPDAWIRWSTPAVNWSRCWASSSLATDALGPAGTWWTLNPGSTSATGGRPRRQDRVNTSQSTPAPASADDSSRTYTFMPPPSPVPGWVSGEV
jgi:hypothetical protein